MPSTADRLTSNAPGPFYVDSSCTDCDLCRHIAPAVFSRDDVLATSRVYKQPITPEETAIAFEALESCPTESIGCERDVAVAAV